MSAQAVEPVAESELDQLFAIFAGHQRIALAVSGGADSLALMHLALTWRKRGRTPDFIVLTVDHGLRAEAAAEAAVAAEAAHRAGLPAQILRRTPPASRAGLQANARADRYWLMSEAATAAGASAIATGHTLDDQAETVLMRLARGSGIDGLSAMAPVVALGALQLLRPLLRLPKLRLEATLRAGGISWSVDPSNADPAFERPRLRALMPAMAASGLTAQAIASSARRLARGRAALEQMTSEALARIVTVHEEGYYEIKRDGYDALPEELRVRVLGRLIGRLGTPGQIKRLSRLERLVGTLASEAHPTSNLAGCLVRASRDRILLLREPGRTGLPRLELSPGSSVDWDRRCRVSLAPNASGPVTVRALAASDLHGHLAAAARASSLPRAIILTAPSAWRGENLVAMPVLGYLSDEVAFVPSVGALALEGTESSGVHLFETKQVR